MMSLQAQEMESLVKCARHPSRYSMHTDVHSQNVPSFCTIYFRDNQSSILFKVIHCKK